MSDLHKDAANLIQRLCKRGNTTLDWYDEDVLQKLIQSHPEREIYRSILHTALVKVTSAMQDYISPDGIDATEFAIRVIQACANPKFYEIWECEKAITSVIKQPASAENEIWNSEIPLAEADEQPEYAEEVLIIAADLVTGNRKESHGEMYESFSQVAAMWTSFLNGRDLTVKPLKPHEVCDMMELLKMSRSTKGDFNHDDYIDRAGYAACAFEVRKREADRNRLLQKVKEL